jgi:hypothetical protein
MKSSKTVRTISLKLNEDNNESELIWDPCIFQQLEEINKIWRQKRAKNSTKDMMEYLKEERDIRNDECEHLCTD